jgi:hypothetical protein
VPLRDSQGGLKAANVPATFDEEEGSFKADRVTMVWVNAKYGWGSYFARSGRPDESEKRLRGVMVALGGRCQADRGGRGWGGCMKPAVKREALLAASLRSWTLGLVSTAFQG